MKKRKIIMDVDPGHDDAIAMIVANKIPNLEILGFTVVSGNNSLERTVINTQNICTMLDIDIPIYRGMNLPMVRDRYLSSDLDVGDVHGETGLDGPVFGPITKQVQNKHAVNFLVDTLLASDEKITLCASGPLSNLGMALRMQPEIKNKIEEIVLMGGSLTSGNVTPSAEFNILADPDAAHIVFSSGVPVTMIGLNITRQALAYADRVNEIRKINNIASKLYCDLVDFFTISQKKAFGWEAPPIHDVVNVVYLANPDAMTFVHCNIEVDRVPGITYGRTVCDVNHIQNSPSKIKFADQLNQGLFWDVITTAIKRYS